jgi:hypothetical protein
MQWFDIFDKHLRIVTDTTDVYYSLKEELDDEDIVWSVIRKAKIDDSYFATAHTAFDTWTICHPTIEYKWNGSRIVYTNILVL